MHTTLEPQTISVMLIDGHCLVRKLLVGRLALEPGLQVLGDFDTPHDALDSIARLTPDVVLLDVDALRQTCVAAAERIHSLSPRTRIVFMSTDASGAYFDQALAAQVGGYVTKDETPEAVIEAVQEAAAGDTYYGPRVLSQAMEQHVALGTEGEQAPQDLLTQRELETLGYIARGLTKKEIAAELKLSVSTVQNHTHNVMSKLNIHNNVQLARYAVRHGLVGLPRQPAGVGLSGLTQRETETLKHVASGLTKKEIAALIDLSVSTVETHIDKVMAKLGIHNKVKLALYAIGEGLAEA